MYVVKTYSALFFKNSETRLGFWSSTNASAHNLTPKYGVNLLVILSIYLVGIILVDFLVLLSVHLYGGKGEKKVEEETGETEEKEVVENEGEGEEEGEEMFLWITRSRKNLGGR